MLDRLGIESRVPRRPAGHHAGGDGRRPHGARRPGRRELVGLLNQHGPLAVGLSGEDAGLFTAERDQHRRRRRGGRPRPGRRGRRACAPRRCCDLVDAGRIPVISSVAPDVDGPVHNVNADTAAAALAVALGAEKLLVLTDVEGLYRDWPDSDDVIGEISPEALAELMPTLASGMVPKMGACLKAVSNGVPARHRRRRPRAARGAAGDLHRRRASAPRCCPASRPRSAPRTTRPQWGQS